MRGAESVEFSKLAETELYMITITLIVLATVSVYKLTTLGPAHIVALLYLNRFPPLRVGYRAIYRFKYIASY